MHWFEGLDASVLKKSKITPIASKSRKNDLFSWPPIICCPKNAKSAFEAGFPSTWKIIPEHWSTPQNFSLPLSSLTSPIWAMKFWTWLRMGLEIKKYMFLDMHPGAGSFSIRINGTDSCNPNSKWLAKFASGVPKAWHPCLILLRKIRSADLSYTATELTEAHLIYIICLFGLGRSVACVCGETSTWHRIPYYWSWSVDREREREREREMCCGK